MAFRTLTIDSAAELHVRSGQLTIQREQDPKPLSIDLDDLACIVLANLDITLSTGALNMISAHGIHGKNGTRKALITRYTLREEVTG